MPERIHYIPRFILRQFKADGRSLLEWDKRRGGTASPRSVEIAGQRPDFWPPHVERGVMEWMDDKASKILQRKVYGKPAIRLVKEERRFLAEWFGLWLIRTPKHLERIRRLTDNLSDHPEPLIEDIYRHGMLHVLRHMQQARKFYDWVYRLNRSLSLTYLYALTFWESLIRQKNPLVMPSAERHFQNFLLPENVQVYADHLERMTWVWFSSGELDFVIGDDPVCRLGTGDSRVDRGLRESDIQVTIPLSRKLSIVMSYGNGPDITTVHTAPEEVVKRSNRRQIFNALEYVYGPSQVALRPDDEAAEYGL